MKNKLGLSIIFLTLLMLTGCTINYDLNFDNGKIIEQIEGEASNSEITPEVEGRNDVNPNYYYLYLDNRALIDSQEEYDKKITDTQNGKKFEFKYEYNNNYMNSRIINTCFEDHFIEETDEYYYIKLNGKFYCNYMDELNINVTSDYKVLSTNAKKINKNTYSWTLDDYDNTDILLMVSKIEKNDNTSKPKLFDTFQLIGLIIFSILVIITYILYKKKNSENI